MDGAGREGPGVVVAADNEELGANFGLFQCPQEGLDPDNGTQLETLETELDREDEEEGDPTMVRGGGGGQVCISSSPIRLEQKVEEG